MEALLLSEADAAIRLVGSMAENAWEGCDAATPPLRLRGQAAWEGRENQGKTNSVQFGFSVRVRVATRVRVRVPTRVNGLSLPLSLPLSLSL